MTTPTTILSKNGQRKRVPRRRQGPGKPSQDIIDATPKEVKVPPPPTRDAVDDKTLHDEQQVLRTEVLMLKGVKDRRQLMALLGVEDPRAMQRYIDRVYARWELIGAAGDFSRARGEGLTRLNMIESELWQILQQEGNRTEPNAQVQLVALRSVLDVHKDRERLQGLNEKTIERLTMVDPAANVQFDRRASDHQKLTEIAKRALQIMGERMSSAARQAVDEADGVIEGKANVPAVREASGGQA